MAPHRTCQGQASQGGMQWTARGLPSAVDCNYTFVMRIEWDDEKNKRNQAKHGVSFETARLVSSDQPERQQRESAEHMSSRRDEQRRELERLAKLPDEDIDTTDIPEVTNFSGAVQGRFYRPVKQQVTLRIDADLLAWFKSRGGKYQTRINNALREYYEAHHGLARKR